MAEQFELITFDVYSALFDIETSFIPVLHPLFGSSVDVAALFRTWRSKQLEYTLINNSLGGEHIKFRTITRRALDYTLDRFNQSLQESTRGELVDAWDRLTPWPEADNVLTILKERGYAIGLLSNGDKYMLEALARSFDAKIDYIFSCEQAGRYKPHAGIYELPLKSLNLKAEQMLHTASGPTDVLGAKAAGTTCVWVNRFGDFLLDKTCRPDWECSNLRGLLDIL
jgi:2-haloacid dehalogenase